MEEVKLEGEESEESEEEKEDKVNTSKPKEIEDKIEE